MKRNRIFAVWVVVSGLLALGITFWLFLFLLYKGGSLVSPEFFLEEPKGMPLGTEGGVFPAIVGSLLLGGLSGLMGGFLSLCTSVYLVFYCEKRWLKRLIMDALQCLAGVPSIVLGLFGYSLFLMSFGLKRSLLTATMTLAIMVIPFITLRLQKAMEETSKEQFVTSLSLGLPKSHTILCLVFPVCLRRILTALGLGIGFAMGATAPIMYTGAVVSGGVPDSVMDPVMALPMHLYTLASTGISMDMAYATAFVLIVLLLIINLLCHFAGAFKGDRTWKK